MSPNETATDEIEFAPEEETVDPIESIFQGECSSLSGRSVLTFVIGRHAEDDTPHLAITQNSGGGMWCRYWASASVIQEVVLGASELTAKSFHVLHPGKSINTGGFVLAVLGELGLVRRNADNTRLHEHVPTTTFASVVKDYMAAAGKSQKRKPKET